MIRTLRKDSGNGKQKEGTDVRDAMKEGLVELNSQLDIDAEKN